MNTKSMAPCGLICDICYAYQRKKNTCDGCNSTGNKTAYCSRCKIKQCPEKSSETELCIKCDNYPCKILKDLEKRYTSKYGESIFSNFNLIDDLGIRKFVKMQSEEWKCNNCGKLLCVHNSKCSYCGAVNAKYPINR
jgi:hypothetical protein